MKCKLYLCIFSIFFALVLFNESDFKKWWWKKNQKMTNDSLRVGLEKWEHKTKLPKRGKIKKVRDEDNAAVLFFKRKEGGKFENITISFLCWNTENITFSHISDISMRMICKLINSKSIWWCKSSIWCRLNVRSC